MFNANELYAIRMICENADFDNGRYGRSCFVYDYSAGEVETLLKYSLDYITFEVYKETVESATAELVYTKKAINIKK